MFREITQISNNARIQYQTCTLMYPYMSEANPTSDRKYEMIGKILGWLVHEYCLPNYLII